MELTFVTDLGHPFVVEIDPNMELENVMALLEAEVCCTPKESDLNVHGNDSRASRSLNKASPTLGGISAVTRKRR
jgi:DNA damage-inducible protein 1